MRKLLGAGLLLALLLPSTIDSREYKIRESKLTGKPAPASQGMLKCEDAKVRYDPFDEAYAKRIVLRSVSDSENPPAAARKEYSPERNRWMAAIEPDTSKPGPWDK